MSAQSRRLRDGLRAEFRAKTIGVLREESDAYLKKLRDELWNGVRALQSTEYVGTPEAQKKVNDRHNYLMSEAKRVDKEIKARKGFLRPRRAPRM